MLQINTDLFPCHLLRAINRFFFSVFFFPGYSLSRVSGLCRTSVLYPWLFFFLNSEWFLVFNSRLLRSVETLGAETASVSNNNSGFLTSLILDSGYFPLDSCELRCASERLFAIFYRIFINVL